MNDDEVTHTLLDDETVIEAELIERDGITFGASFPVESYNPPS